MQDGGRPHRPLVEGPASSGGAANRLVAATAASRAAAAAVVGVPPSLLLLWSGAGLLWSAGLAGVVTVALSLMLASDARQIADGELPGQIDVLVPFTAVTAVSLYLSFRNANLPWWWHAVVLAAALAIGALCAIVATALLKRIDSGPGPRDYVHLAARPLAPSSTAVAVILLDQGVGMPLWTSVLAGAALGVGTAVLVGQLVRPRLT